MSWADRAQAIVADGNPLLALLVAAAAQQRQPGDGRGHGGHRHQDGGVAACHGDPGLSTTW